jgi:hypothetical protein
MTTSRKSKTASESAVPAVRVTRPNRKARALAREHPNAYPELSNAELLSDLENPSLEED